MEYMLFTKPWRDLSVEALGQHARSLGFGQIELPVRDGFQCTPDTVEQLPTVSDQLRDQGVRVRAIATREHVLGDERFYAACATAGVTLNRVMFPVHGQNYWDAERHARDLLDAALPFCQQYGVRIGVQNHSGHWVGGSAMGLYHLLKDYDVAHVGAVWDPAHNALAGEPPEIAVDVLRPYLLSVNLKNGFRRRTNGPEASDAAWKIHWTSGRHGVASWARVAELLHAVAYTGPLSMFAEYSDESELDRLVVDDLEFARTLFG